MTRPRATSGPVDDLAAVIAELSARLRNLETVGHQHLPTPAAPAWTTWTPTVANLSVGTGTNGTTGLAAGIYASYLSAYGSVDFEVLVNYGTGASAIAGAMTFTTPTTPQGYFVCAAYMVSIPLGFRYDMSANNNPGALSTVTLYTKRLNAFTATTDLKLTQSGVGTPITNPTSTDYLVISGTYQTT